MTKEYIEACRRIVREKQAEKIDRLLIDILTAKAVITVYDYLTEKGDTEKIEILERIDMYRLAKICVGATCATS